MGEFNITQDEYVTRKLMVSAPKGSHLQLATGYFNLTEQYTRTLLDQCKANVSLLMAHPNVSKNMRLFYEYYYYCIIVLLIIIIMSIISDVHICID